MDGWRIQINQSLSYHQKEVVKQNRCGPKRLPFIQYYFIPYINILSLRVIQQNDDDHLVIIGLTNEPVWIVLGKPSSAHFCCSVHRLVMTVQEGKVPENINPAGSTVRGTHSCGVMAGMWGWLLFISAWPSSPFLRSQKSSDWVDTEADGVNRWWEEWHTLQNFPEWRASDAAPPRWAQREWKFATFSWWR